MLLISSGLMLAGALLLLLMRSHAQRADRLQGRLNRLALRDLSTVPDTIAAWRQAEASRSEKARLQQQLQQAGFTRPDALRLLMFSKAGMAILLALSSWLALPQSSSLRQLLVAIVAMVVGSMLPEMYLQRLAQRVSGRIAATVPEAMDLLVICLEAGMSVDRAFRRVGEELDTVAPELARELRTTEAELQVMPDRQKALEGLAWRTRVEEIEQLVFTLVQAERFGTPVAPTMRQLAADIRQLQMLKLEEKLGRIPARMGLPLMLLIMFPLVVLIAGPPVVSLIRSLQ